jgi:hypothetical protein
MTDMMDITPRMDAIEYVNLLASEAKRKERRYSNAELIGMLHDVRQQIADRDPKHRLIRRIENLTRKIGQG